MGGQYYIGSFPWISSSESVCSDRSCPLFHPGCCHAKPSCEWGPTSLGVSFQLREGSKRAPHSSGSEPKCSKWNRVDGIKETRSRACLIPIARCPAVLGQRRPKYIHDVIWKFRATKYTAGEMIPTRYLLGTSLDIGWSRARQKPDGRYQRYKRALANNLDEQWRNGSNAPCRAWGDTLSGFELDTDSTVQAIAQRSRTSARELGSAQLHSLKVYLQRVSMGLLLLLSGELDMSSPSGRVEVESDRRKRERL